MRLLLATLLFLPTLLFSQVRHNANWVFGNYCGLTFNPDSTVTPFVNRVVNRESICTFSDTEGNLMFYSSWSGRKNYSLFDANGMKISNSDSMQFNSNITNGISAFPINEDSVFIFHLNYTGICTTGYWSWSYFCTALYFSIVTRSGNTLTVTTKNNLISGNLNLSEKLAITRHANGKDWWLLSTGADYCSNTIVSFRISGSKILGSFEQDIGFQKCWDYDAGGELAFSPDGEKLALCSPVSNKIELFKFDRCSGILFDPLIVDVFSGNTYGAFTCNFSPNSNVLYIALHTDNRILLQYDLRSTPISSSKQIIWTNDTSNISGNTGQLELAIDGKIYLAHNSVSPARLSTIHQPDSLGVKCDFRLLDLYISDSCRTSFGLPVNPNYNLGPLSIYKAAAYFKDTLIVCVNDSNIKGVTLGDSIGVPNVQYYWEGQAFSSPNQSYQFVILDSTYTTVYLTLTDTTIKYSCQSRTDTVVVMKQICPKDTVGINEISQSRINIYPNPTSGTLSIESPAQGRLILYDLSAKQIQQITLPSGRSSHSIKHLPPGLYIYKVWIGGELKQTDKIVKVE